MVVWRWHWSDTCLHFRGGCEALPFGISMPKDYTFVDLCFISSKFLMSNLENLPWKSIERFFLQAALFTRKWQKSPRSFLVGNKSNVWKCFIHWGMSSPTIWPDLISSAISYEGSVSFAESSLPVLVFPHAYTLQSSYCSLSTTIQHHHYAWLEWKIFIFYHRLFSWIFKSWFQPSVCFAGAKRCLWQIWC